jgi:phage I-like protein
MPEPILARYDGRPAALEVAADGSAPSDIQYMPPGRQTITPLRDGQPVQVTIVVDEATAQTLEASLLQALARGDRPWFDYNHEDGAASGHPLRFYWAGEDPKKGGVRCEVQWTPTAAQAIVQREYRHLSPVFFADEKGRITGAPLNMGGLVNASAFRNREPFWNKATMNEPELQALQAKLTAAEAELTKLRARLTELEAKERELTALQTRYTDLEGRLKAARQEQARACVAEAVRAGRLPPQAAELHAKWQALIEEHPEHAALLAALPTVLPAGQTVPPGGKPAPAAGNEPVPTAKRWSAPNA